MLVSRQSCTNCTRRQRLQTQHQQLDSMLKRFNMVCLISAHTHTIISSSKIHPGNLQMNVWDLAGQSSLRPYWRCYFNNTTAIIFVIDSCDRERLSLAKQELFALLDEEELKSTVICVFANKQDQPMALSAVDIAEALELIKIKSHTWQIFPTSAVKNLGLKEGLDWLATAITDAPASSTVSSSVSSSSSE